MTFSKLIKRAHASVVIDTALVDEVHELRTPSEGRALELVYPLPHLGMPVINIDKNPRKLARLKAARKAMSAEAKAWRPAAQRSRSGA
jgi:hypothetical protein